MNSLRLSLRRLGEASRIRRLLSALLVLAAAALVAGVVTEHFIVRHAVAVATQAGHTAQGEATGHAEGGTEAGGESSPPGGGGSGTGATETVLGLQAESPGLVTVAVLLSLGAAGLVLAARRRTAVVGAGALAVAFVIVDCAELLHQAGEARATIAAFAGLTKVLHVAAALTAGAVLLHRQQGHEPALP